MLEWYTTLLTFNQAVAVYLVSIVALTVVYWILFVTTSGGEDDGAGRASFVLALITYPLLYWVVFLIVAFLDLIGWLWAQ